jgi:GH43 family beta-xylosidase
LQRDNGRLYFIWSGWPGEENVTQNLYIAPMANPWTISGPRTQISKPELLWEVHGRPLVNEGPQILRNGKRVFIVYSASGSWTDHYCLGLLELTGNDPLNASAWSKAQQAVFSRTENVFGPGHASFVKSPDGREDWIVYHAAKRQGSGWDRNVRMQQFGWNTDGTPNFGKPVSAGVPLPVPSEVSR